LLHELKKSLHELCGCQLVLRTSKPAGARGDVQKFGGCLFGGCQAPAAPVLTQALLDSGDAGNARVPSEFGVQKRGQKKAIDNLLLRAPLNLKSYLWLCY
jgi:hypothetical protein